MKKVIPFMLGSLLLLGATACTDGDGVRSDQIESDARARDQRGMNPGTDATDGDGVRNDQIASDARARAQREGMDAATAANVTIEYLSGNLANYLGRTVSIRGDVEEIAGDHAFLLGGDLLFGGEGVFIINASGQSLDLIEGEGTNVQVTGEVREFILDDIESEYGFDLDNNLFADYENQPVIVAQSMALSPDPSNISNNPEAYYFRRLAIEGNIATMLNANTMTISDEGLFGGDGILAISPSEAITAGEGAKVVITGVLRPYAYADIDQEHNLAWNLDFQEKIKSEYQNKPVFIIDSIYPSAL